MENNIHVLHEFIVNNENLELLEKEVNEFNPLKILKVNSLEIRHSNILSWLLAPNETHRFGDYIIKKVITETLLTNDDKNIDFPEVHDISLINLYDMEILREWENIDLLSVSRSSKLAILIENKIHSKERKGQLQKYLRTVNKHFPDYKILPILLTKFGDDPEDSEQYCSLSHQSIYRIVKFALEMHLDSLNAKVADFIQYYLKTLEELLMEDEKLKELCKKIYLQHKDAIDLIVQYAMTTSFSEAVESFLEKNDNIERIHSSTNLFAFVPKEFVGVVPTDNLYTRDQYLVIYWFQKKSNDKLQLTLEVGTFPDPEDRMKFMEHLNSAGVFKIPNKALEGQSKFTRIYTKQVSIHDWDDVESIVKRMQDLYERDFKDINKNIVTLVKQYWSKKYTTL